MRKRLLIRLVLALATLAVAGAFALYNEASNERLAAARAAAEGAVERARAAGLATPLDEPRLVAALDEASRAWGAVAALASNYQDSVRRSDVDVLLEALRVPASDAARAASLLESFAFERPGSSLIEIASRVRELRRAAATAQARAVFWERVARKPTALDLRVLALLEAERERSKMPDAPAWARLAALHATPLFLSIPDASSGTGNLDRDDWERFALATGHAPTIAHASLVLTATSRRTTVASATYRDAKGNQEYLARWRFNVSVLLQDGEREVWKGELEGEDPPLPDEQVFVNGTHGYHVTQALLRDALLAKAGELGEVLSVTEPDDDAARELSRLLASE